jgi:hypothetical protein
MPPSDASPTICRTNCAKLWLGVRPAALVPTFFGRAAGRETTLVVALTG